MKTVARVNRRSSAGFSLFELLVVMSIMAVVTGIGTRTFFLMTSQWNNLKSMADLDAIAYSAFQSMQDDFAEVLSAELSGVSIRAFAEEYTHDPLLQPFRADEIVLPVQTAIDEGEFKSVGSIRYHVVRDETEGTYGLYRSVGTLTAGLPIGARSPIITRANVLSLRYEFLGGESGEWQFGWESPQLPAAVRLSLTLADLNRSDLQISRKTVFPIHVR